MHSQLLYQRVSTSTGKGKTSTIVQAKKIAEAHNVESSKASALAEELKAQVEQAAEKAAAGEVQRAEEQAAHEARLAEIQAAEKTSVKEAVTRLLQLNYFSKVIPLDILYWFHLLSIVPVASLSLWNSELRMSRDIIVQRTGLHCFAGQ